MDSEYDPNLVFEGVGSRQCCTYACKEKLDPDYFFSGKLYLNRKKWVQIFGWISVFFKRLASALKIWICIIIWGWIWTQIFFRQFILIRTFLFDGDAVKLCKFILPHCMHSLQMGLRFLWLFLLEKLNNRDGQTDSRHVDRFFCLDLKRRSLIL